MMIHTIDDLENAVSKKWIALAEISPEYLSDAGNAAKEAYQFVIWYISFHESIDTLVEDEEFANLVNIPDKHPEYYKVIRMINRALERVVNQKKGI